MNLGASRLVIFQHIGVKSTKKRCWHGTRSPKSPQGAEGKKKNMFDFTTLHGERNAQNPYLTRALFGQMDQIRLTSFPLAAYQALTSFVPSACRLWRVWKTIYKLSYRNSLSEKWPKMTFLLKFTWISRCTQYLFLNTSSQTILDVKIVKILTLRGDRERQIYYLTRAFFNVFWRKIDRNPYLTRRFRGPKLLPYTRVFHCRALAAERCTKQR